MSENGKWFYTGYYMSDGKTPRTVYIEGDVNIRASMEQGLKPVEDKKIEKKAVKKTAKKDTVKKETTKESKTTKKKVIKK